MGQQPEGDEASREVFNIFLKMEDTAVHSWRG